MLSPGSAGRALSGPRGVWDHQEGGTDPSLPLPLAPGGLSPGAWGLGGGGGGAFCGGFRGRLPAVTSLLLSSFHRTPEHERHLPLAQCGESLMFSGFWFALFFVLLFRAAPVADGSSQARS